MVENKRGYSGVIDLKEKVFFIGVLIVFLLGALLWYNYVHRLEELTPKQVFEQAFIESPDSITDLEGNSNLSFGYDYWIKFKTFTGVHLRNAEKFKPSVFEVGRRWFAEKWLADPALHDTAASYDYLTSTTNGIGKVASESFLTNKRRHCYFYRRFGI